MGEDAQPYRSLRQRIGLTGTSSSSTDPYGGTPDNNVFLETILKDWAKGHLSSTKFQEYCFGADAVGAKGVKRFSEIGSSGNLSNNAQRDLIRELGTLPGAPYLYWAKLRFKDKDGAVTERLHPFVLPHELFTKLNADRRAFFEAHILGSAGGTLTEDLQEFWELHADNPVVAGHPIIGGRPELLPLTAPLGIHGDAGEFSKQQDVFVISWNSLVGKGSTSQTRFPITCLNKTELLDDGSTLNEVWEVIAWSFNLLAHREFPLEDHTGQRFADTDHRFKLAIHGEFCPGRGVVLQLRGDWQFLCQAFGFPQWNSVDNMCWICAAGKLFPWTDMRPQADWRATVRTHDMYLADCAEKAAAGGAPLSVSALQD